MPHMDFAIKLGDLNRSQRAILQVIELHPDNMWCMSASDLKELAIWATAPGHRNPPPYVKRVPEDSVTEETRFEDVRPTRLYRGRRGTTYSLKTVRSALIELSEKKKIWSFGLYRLTYYASEKSKRRVMSWLSKLPPDQLERAEFREYIEE